MPAQIAGSLFLFSLIRTAQITASFSCSLSHWQHRNKASYPCKHMIRDLCLFPHPRFCIVFGYLRYITNHFAVFSVQRKYDRLPESCVEFVWDVLENLPVSMAWLWLSLRRSEIETFPFLLHWHTDYYFLSLSVCYCFISLRLFLFFVCIREKKKSYSQIRREQKLYFSYLEKCAIPKKKKKRLVKHHPSWQKNKQAKGRTSLVKTHVLSLVCQESVCVPARVFSSARTRDLINLIRYSAR